MEALHNFAASADLRVGDPTIIGWATTLLYFVAALISLNAARRRPDTTQTAFWACTSLLLVALGANKELDFQTTLIELGRFLSKEHGWFDDRRSFQLAFTLALFFTGIVVATVGLWLAGRADPMVRCAVFGLVLIGLYVGGRTAEINHQLGTQRFLHDYWIVELLGIIITAAAAGKSGYQSNSATGMACQRTDRP